MKHSVYSEYDSRQANLVEERIANRLAKPGPLV